MNILHICGNYIGSKLYKNLFNELSKKDVTQTVVVPVNKCHINEENTKQYSVLYFDLLNILTRVFYLYKIKRIYKNILLNPLLKNTDIVHAHTFFSDGGVAYLLNKKFNIPYIVAVRNTDINTFLKYKRYLRFYGKNIVRNATSIVFLSTTYKDKFISLMPKSVRDEIENKAHIIPNGIDDFWHTNCKDSFKNNTDTFDLLFVGLIDKNKNLKFNIEVLEMLKEKGYQCSLHVVGTGPELDNCKNLVKQKNLEMEVRFYGKIPDRKQLEDIMHNCNFFLLNSKFETFGLVYAEALSQGLYLFYTRGQGFDGQFEDGVVGYSIEYNNLFECIERLKGIHDYGLEKNDNMNICNLIYKFNWKIISEKYIELYSFASKGDGDLQDE